MHGVLVCLQNKRQICLSLLVSSPPFQTQPSSSITWTLKLSAIVPHFHSCPFNPVHSPPNSQINLSSNVIQIPSLSRSKGSYSFLLDRELHLSVFPWLQSPAPSDPASNFISSALPLAHCRPDTLGPLLLHTDPPAPPYLRVPAHVAPSIRDILLPLLAPAHLSGLSLNAMQSKMALPHLVLIFHLCLHGTCHN